MNDRARGATDAVQLQGITDELSGPNAENPQEGATRAAHGEWKVPLWVTQSCDIFAKISTVAVLVLAWWQYYQAGIDKTRERAMEMVTEWVEGGQAERLARVSEYLHSAATQAQAQIDAMPEAARERGWENAEKVTFGGLAEPPSAEIRALRRDIDQIFSFFTRAEICVSSDLCDAEVMRAYFLVEARSLTTELTPFIARVRDSGYPSYGAATEAFVQQVDR